MTDRLPDVDAVYIGAATQNSMQRHLPPPGAGGSAAVVDDGMPVLLSAADSSTSQNDRDHRYRPPNGRGSPGIGRDGRSDSGSRLRRGQGGR